MSLFRTKNFLPLFITQFLGAFNDNLLKNALVMLVTYHIAQRQHIDAQFLVTLAGGVFILPFFLFSATAGQMADKYNRATLTHIIKTAEIAIMFCAIAGFVLQNITILMMSLFFMGTHSTFFGPIKYALLPQHLPEKHLLEGNAIIEAGTFLAVLLGTILGGILILNDGGVLIVCLMLMVIAVLGYISSRYIPDAPAPDKTLKINLNIFQETKNILDFSTHNKSVFLSILGISWFWVIGATFLSQFPIYAKDILYSDETVVTLFLTIFSVGVGAGSFLCHKLLKGHIQSTYVPISVMGISVFMVDLFFASHNIPPHNGELYGAWDFISTATGIHIAIDLFLIALCSGLYIVPLYAIMQQRSDPSHRARVIAANNVMNALFMVISAVVILFLLKICSIPQLFLVLSVINFGVAIYICKILPDALLRSTAQFILKTLFRVEIKGMEHYHNAGNRILLIANHTSFLDALLIAAFLPEKITFAVNSNIAKIWWIKPMLGLVDAFALDPLNPMSVKALIDVLKQDKKCMIFPEGRITVTGSLMKIYEGPGMIADKSGAKLLPIRIDGGQYSLFSRLHGKVRLQWFPKITLTILPACEFAIPDDIKGRGRRQIAGFKLYDIMSAMMFQSSDYKQTLFQSLLSAEKIHGKNHIIAEDIQRQPITYRQLILRSFVMGYALAKHIMSQKHIGIMLPSALANLYTFFGIQSLGLTPAMINFTAGASSIVTACHTAGVKTIITSSHFITAGKYDSLVKHLTDSGIKMIYLEDIKKNIGLKDKLFGIIASFMPHYVYSKICSDINPNAAAFILFTSGSEGTPKAVLLSHINIQANRHQLASRIDFGSQDIVFNCLPMFHAFGLTGGTILPILSGIRTFFYPSPLHYRIVPELVYDINATILFGTDTFLANYARFAHPYDFHSVRYIFAGAEKLKSETRKIYAEKYGVRIFEGYGATETAPVLTTNTPMQNRTGTVGRFMPDIEWKLMPVTGVDTGGQLWVKGPNIMLGYMRADNPAQLQPPADGWYDTGDIVTVDDLGYVTIMGRTKRFAKIGGEMVSLSMVETVIDTLWSDTVHAVVSIPDEKKGEQIILITTYPFASRDILIKYFREQKISELSVPKTIIIVESLPVLGTGKTDYQAVKNIGLQGE